MVLGMNNSSRGSGGDYRRNPRRDTSSRQSTDYSQHQSSSQPNTQQPPTITVQPKHMPSAEQVHIARMLTEDRTPSDIQERIHQVQSVVDCPEESIVIALHDHEFDITKACEALLDSNGSSKEEWMTMSTSKKSKKKPSEQQRHKSSSSKGSSKAASLSTRQNYGGSVTVTTSGEDNERKSSSGGRSRNTQPSGPKGGGGGIRGERRRDRPPSGGGGYRGRKQDGRYSSGGGGASFEGRFPPRHRSKEIREDKAPQDQVKEKVEPPVNEESWGDDEVVPKDTPTTPPSNDEWVIVDTPPPVFSFPDAIGRHFYAEQNENEETINTSVADDVSVKMKVNKQRRVKVSRIPSQPVEMPNGIDTLSFEISMLGIGFGVETTPTATPTSETPSAVEPRVPSPLSYEQSSLTHQQPLTMNNNSSILTSTSPYNDSIADDPIIISSFKEKPPDTLEPPPGLVHPSQQQASNDIVKPATPTSSLLPPPPDPISLPPLTSSQAPSTSGLLSNTGISSLSEGGVVGGNEPESSYVVMKHHPSGSSSSFAAGSVTSTNTPSSLFSSSSITPPSTNPVAVVTLSQQPSSLPVSSANNTSGASSRIHGSTSGAPVHLNQVGKVHSTSTSGSSGGGTGVHPMAVYPPLLPQFHAPYGTAPVMMPPYTYDVDSMNRYQGFYGQHPTSQEQGGGTASLTSGIVRDPQSGGGGVSGSTGTLPFSADGKYEGTTSTQAQPQQQALQQQQQAAAHNQLNHPFYSQFPYLMYAPPMGMAPATGYSTQQMGHKPTGGSSYPPGTSYQPVGASHQYPYDEVYASMKNNQVTSTTSADFNAFPKHQFDQKGNAFSYNMPMGVPGGYVMGHHHVPAPPPVMGHESSRTKSHKYTTPTAAAPGWPSTHTHN